MKEKPWTGVGMIRLRNLRLDWKNRLLLSFVGGLFFGIVYANFFAGNYFEEVGFISDYFLIQYLQEDVDKNQLFPYLLKGRGLSFFLIWIMGSSFLGSILIYLVLVWIGFSIGIYVVAAIAKYGLGGIGFCMAAVFPQALFYIPAFGLVLLQAYAIRVKSNRNENSLRSHSFELKSSRKEIMVPYVFVLLLGLVLLFLGILTESYMNPQIVKNLLEKY